MPPAARWGHLETRWRVRVVSRNFEYFPFTFARSVRRGRRVSQGLEMSVLQCQTHSEIGLTFNKPVLLKS